jgi:hypothetical protein
MFGCEEYFPLPSQFSHLEAPSSDPASYTATCLNNKEEGIEETGIYIGHTFE